MMTESAGMIIVNLSDGQFTSMVAFYERNA